MGIGGRGRGIGSGNGFGISPEIPDENKPLFNEATTENVSELEKLRTESEHLHRELEELKKTMSKLDGGNHKETAKQKKLLAAVNQNLCMGCAICVSSCPRGAIFMNSKRLAEIDKTKCDGCNACVSVCPNRAITLS
jgi:ferredoxin